MNLSLDDLRAFCMVVQEKSISKAAQNLHMSQPSLSQRILGIESALGVTLLQRTRQGVLLTPSGERLYNTGQRILNLKENLEQELEEIRRSSEKLSIGACTTLGGYILPCTLLYFKNSHPDATIKLVVDNTEAILSKLNDGLIDIALVEEDKLDKQYSAEQIIKDELALVVPPTKEWLQKEYITLQELLTIPLILPEENSGTHAIIRKALSKHNLALKNLQILMEFGSIDGIKCMVQGRRAASILSCLAVRRERDSGLLHTIPIKGLSLSYNLVVLRPNNTDLTPLQQEFLTEITTLNEQHYCQRQRKRMDY